MPPLSGPLAPIVSPVSQTTNAKKRTLADSDNEERDVKRAKSQDNVAEIERHKDTKERKKRRKRKRKASVVSAQGALDADVGVAPKASGSRSRSRSMTLAGSSPRPAEPSITPKEPASTTPPTAAHSAAPLRKPSPSHSSSSKGKEPAITDLQDQVSVKTNVRLSVVSSVTPLIARRQLVSKHETLVSAFQQSLSCQICLDLMHKPFALAPCGHSACYQCLVNWFKAPPPDVPANEVLPVWLRRKTCPHCRTVVKERPIEIWTIKDMVATLVKSGLAQAPFPLPPVPEDAPANADAWSGIFLPANRNRGVFPEGHPPELMQQLIGMRDEEDGGIYRCIDCHHEIMDGACSQCGRVYPGHDPFGHDPDEFDEDDGFGHWGDPGRWDDDLDDDLEDDEDDGEDGVGGWGHLEMLRQLFFPDPLGDSDSEYSAEVVFHPAPWEHGQGWNPNHGLIEGPRVAGDAIIEEDHDGEDEDGYESSFIDDGDDDRPRRYLPRPIDFDHDSVIDLTDAEEGGADDAEAVDDEEVELVGFSRRRGGIRRGPIIVDSDEEDEVDEKPLQEDVHGVERHVEDHGNDEDGDLAAEVAAREYDMYGDDGSVPRATARLECYTDSEGDGEGSGYDDEYSY
ncbi:hypothetical protein BC628DRAFT_1364217 [Trametes gibbosa]|uniref:RING-type domain-containing protein n=1 Tax=Trametes gibbosa TaxID=160864 RepID=A0A6G6FQL4_9APHY|nr:hypothetical protein BC628DRAFT_1389828 [Trametes gibbosa]KAI0828141.1 hypothetical protein BC628DRAFT_1364217 [Trametes gibbosa]QIE48517.1 hypothetical protein [Trametes gibbosa]QIE48589.1 hypothetical protein [Trametes gibbosa]